MSHDDFDVEPVPGLPAHLPKGETMLWQGRPDWKAIAVRVFHVRLIAIYFAVLALWRVTVIAQSGGTLADIAVSVTILAALAAGAIGIFSTWAYFIGRTTIYTITSRRLVFRFGVALPVTVNLPYSAIDGAALKVRGNGIGDIPLVITEKQRVSYVLMWPHARPWRLAHPQPMLRAIPDAAGVAALLAKAYSASTPARLTLNDTDTAPAAVASDGRLSPVAG